MKITRLIKNAAIALVGLALIHSTGMAQTILTTSYTNMFPTAGNTTDFTGGSVASWIDWYGLIGGNAAMTNDPTMTPSGNTNEFGSLYISLPFTNVGNQQTIFGTFDNAYGYDKTVVMPLNIVTQLAFDIHVQPGSPTNSSGNFGTITMALIDPNTSGADYGYFTGITIPGSATNGWVHLVDSNTVSDIVTMEGNNISQTIGPGFDYNSYGGYPTNPITFWIGNVAVVTAALPPPPPPPPTVSISPTMLGLNLFTGNSSLYNRESLETVNANYSWVGATGPVSYSFTITNYSVGSNDAVQTQIFLVPNPGTESAPDYTEPNLVFMDMESTTTGASVNFRYKTNEPNGNTMVYGVGTLASIATNTAIGTWTLTFNNNTNVTMTIPGGASTNFSIPDSTGATTALFASGVELYFGVQAGNAGGTSDHIVASDFTVTGLGSADFNDNFVADAGTLNTSLWETNAAFPPCVELVGPADPYRIQWTSPAIGYVLDTTAVLSDDSDWTAVTNNPSFVAGTNYTQLVSTNDLQPGKDAFFAVIQHNNGLQVLFPGETAAPGTLTGKTGTPTPVSLSTNASVTVTVNAVDSKWNLIPTINDTVAITSSDSAATLPGNGALAGGTAQVQITFATTGSQTVTATDVSNSSVAPNTSSKITVTP
jgi:hypothetical protein